MARCTKGGKGAAEREGQRKMKRVEKDRWKAEAEAGG